MGYYDSVLFEGVFMKKVISLHPTLEQQRASLSDLFTRASYKEAMQGKQTEANYRHGYPIIFQNAFERMLDFPYGNYSQTYFERELAALATSQKRKCLAILMKFSEYLKAYVEKIPSSGETDPLKDSPAPFSLHPELTRDIFLERCLKICLSSTKEPHTFIMLNNKPVQTIHNFAEDARFSKVTDTEILAEDRADRIIGLTIEEARKKSGPFVNSLIDKFLELHPDTDPALMRASVLVRLKEGPAQPWHCDWIDRIKPDELEKSSTNIVVFGGIFKGRQQTTEYLDVAQVPFVCMQAGERSFSVINNSLISSRFEGRLPVSHIPENTLCSFRGNTIHRGPAFLGGTSPRLAFSVDIFPSVAVANKIYPATHPITVGHPA
jgi:hypothetical protein